MPTYDYVCDDCGSFEALRSLAVRNEACACPACGAPSHRAILNAPRLAAMSGAGRMAMETNERASHAPRSSKDLAGGYGRLRHPSGCGCCSTKRSGATVTADNGAKMFPGKRPWMISH